MKERILVANSINNTEFLRTLARFGSKQFLLRILNPVEFAKEALFRSGKVIKEEIINNDIQVYIINDLIKESSYFKNASFSDSYNLNNSLNELRLMISNDEKEAFEAFIKGEFDNKNKAIKDIYTAYRQVIDANQQIDSIGIIRKAIKEANQIDSEIVILKELPLEPLEEELVKKLSKNEVKEISILELFNAHDKNIKVNDFVSAYGSTNEFEDILSTIYKKKLPLDECLIVTAKNTYNQLIYDLSINRGIPVTFGSGLSINNSSAFGLLKLFIEHRDNKYGTDTLRRIITSDLFDTKKFIQDIDSNETDLESIIKIIGDLKLEYGNKDYNDKLVQNYVSAYKNDKYSTQIKKTKDIFNNEVADIIENYVAIRNEIDSSSLDIVINAIRGFNEGAKENDIKELISVLGNKNIAKQLSKEGYLHVTSVKKAFNSIRKNMFMFGFGANSFPGTPKENYLLLDSDIEVFTKNGHTSNNEVSERQKTLMSLVRLGSSLDCNISISYSDFNVAELKKENPASIIFDIYQEMHKELDGEKLYEAYQNVFRKVAYFNHRIKKDEKLGQAYIEGKRIIIKSHVDTLINNNISINDMIFYPTKIEDYFTCPRKFYLKHIENIQEDEEDNPYQVIDAKNTGTLYHEAMEELANRKLAKKPMPFDEYKKLCEDIFNRYLLTRPALYDDARDNEKEEFIEMCINGYNQEKDNDVIEAEQQQESEYDGLKIGGKPDRIEKDKDGKYLIADFKTGRNIVHDATDIETCFQILLYAYMTEKNKGVTIDHCEYRYPRLDQVVTCVYDDNAKNEIDKLMQSFKKGIESFDFPLVEKAKRSEACRNCKFGDICGKNEEEDEDDE